MKKHFVMTVMAVATFGMVSSVAVAQKSVATEGLYQLTKSCAKNKVRRKGRCTPCPKGTHANKKQTKCYWNKKKMMSRGSHAAPKKMDRGSY